MDTKINTCTSYRNTKKTWPGTCTSQQQKDNKY